MGDITIRRALDDYKATYMAYRNFADRTRIEYQNDLENLVEYLDKSGTRRVGDLQLAQIERYLAELERRGFTGATRKRKTVVIRSFFKFLYQDRYIDRNIAQLLIPPFVDSKIPTYLTEAEYNRLREACAGNVRDAAIVELLLQTGIRLSELTSLILDDIEFQDDGGLIRIRGGRGKEERILPLNSKACQTLNAYLNQRSDPDNPTLFLNRFGKPLGDRGVQKIIKEYFHQSGIIGASIHSLRHTFAVQHLAKGTSLKTVQKMMGHKDIRTTEEYIPLANEVTIKELEENAL
jgi:site-specific recombinase XerD